MAIPSILRLISYLFNTSFLLVNFAIVKKNNYKKGASIGPPAPLPPWIRHCKFTSSFNSSRFLEFGKHFIHELFLSVFGFGIQPYLFFSQRRMFLLLRVRKIKTSSNNFFWKEIIKWLKRFQVLLDPFVETSILFGILKYKYFKLIIHIHAFFFIRTSKFWPSLVLKFLHNLSLNCSYKLFFFLKVLIRTTTVRNIS